MSKSWILRGAAFLAVSLLSAGGAHAQIFTPSYLPPRLVNNTGIYVAEGPGDLAVEGIWRRGVYGLRAGFVDAGDGSLSIGGEVSNAVRLEGAPIGLLFSAAAQAIVGDANAVGVQGGFSAGHTFTPQGANLAITPYVHPRLALVSGISDADDDLDLDVLAELGFEFAFAPNLLFRIAANLGDGPDWGIGVAWRQ